MAKALDFPHMETPLPFIQTATDGSMHVNEDLAYVLSQAKQPIGVIAIVGKYRTGKSYIMNRFFNTNAGFNLGPTIQSTTKGIWLWARPHPLDPQRTLVLLDTEGLHDVEKGDETHDMKLFSLALLLSNCLVYNAVGALDDVIIQQLHLVMELTDHIKTRDDKEEDGNHFNKYFPYFFLLLRDFFLDLKIDGVDCSPDQYLENALKLRPGRGRKINDYNEPRECIRTYFPRRKCFTLCKPVDDDNQLKRLDTVKEGDVKPQFLGQAKEATDTILAEAKLMTVDGNPINGARFMELARHYVKCINGGAVPCISNAVELLKTSECQRAVEAALTVFERMMKEQLMDRFPVEHDTMIAVQGTSHKAALDHYRQGALFDEGQEYMKKLAAELERKYQEFIGLNSEASVATCDRVLSEAFGPINQKIRDGKYMGKGGYEAYKKDKDSAVHKYNQTLNKGPMSENMLNQYLESRTSEEEAIINADKALTKKEKELAKENEERKRQEDRARVAEEEQQRLMQDFLRQQGEHQKMIHDMQSDFQDKQTKLMEDYNRDMKEKESEYNRLMSEGLNKQAEQYKTLMDDMREDRKKLDEQHQLQVTQIEEYRRQHSDLLDEMRSQRETSSKQISVMQDQIRSMQSRPKPGRCSIM